MFHTISHSPKNTFYVCMPLTSTSVSSFMLVCYYTHIQFFCPALKRRCCHIFQRNLLSQLTLLHSERPKLYTILAFLSAIGFKICCSASLVLSHSGSSNEGSQHLKCEEGTKIISELPNYSRIINKYIPHQSSASFLIIV